MHGIILKGILRFVFPLLIGITAFGQTKSEPKVVDLSKVGSRAWVKQSVGTEIDVVQNRRYTSAQRFEFDLLGGFTSLDPFLSVTNFGASLGYHFNSFYSLHLVGWKYSVSPSTAAVSFLSQAGATAAVNPPSSFLGAEFDGNLLYGKMSVLGKVIIYIDVFVFGGAGVEKAQNGSSLAPFLGLGQRVYLDRHFGIKIDYRMMRFNETVIGQLQTVNRATLSNTVNLGLSYLF